MIVTDLERRLKNLFSTRVHDDHTLSDLDALFNDCSLHLNRLVSSSDPTTVALILPCLLHTIISLSKNCSEKSEIILPGPYLSREKLTSLIALAKSLHNQIKEFVKTPQLNLILSRSCEQRHFCEQLRLVADSIAQTDILTTLICHKLIVKLLTGNDDPQQSQSSVVRIDQVNDGLIMAVYRSVLQQMATICAKNFREKADNTRESPTIKMYGIYFQMLSKLVQYNGSLAQMDSYREFLRTMLQLHQCLESTCQQNRFQLEFFNNTVVLQEILQDFFAHAFLHSSTVFFDDFSLELSTSPNAYAALVFLFRSIEAFDVSRTKHNSDLSMPWIGLFTTHLLNLIDECRVPLILPALLPMSFAKAQVEYGSLYDIAYSHLTRLVHHEPMQTVLLAMSKMIQSSHPSHERASTIFTSIQLASELIIQSWFTFHPSVEYQSLFALFLAELLRLDIHASFVQHCFTLPNSRGIKFRTYEAIISADKLPRVCDLFLTFDQPKTSQEPIVHAGNLAFIFPTNIDQLCPFVRLFQSELTSHQLQHALDTCNQSIQQILSLPVLSESTCRYFLLTLRLLTYLTNVSNQQESVRCLLGRLVHIFILLDEQTAVDIRLELMRVFAVHSNYLDDNDLERLMDFMLTNAIESSWPSIAFHLGCLDLVDSVRQRPGRTANTNDLIIQLIVRYGNEHQASQLLKAQLMV